MRFVVYGAGAVGGVVAGRLFQHGHDVVVIARGAHADAIAERGLTVLWPEGEVTVPVPVVRHPDELTFTADDVVLVAVKSQDTAGIVEALAGCAPEDIPVVCVQNGVANERAVLRRFARVHGVPVLAPTTHLEPGVVLAHARHAAAVLDIGRWPSGTDATSEVVSAAFRDAGFTSQPRADIPRWKYAKLLLNLGNAVDALCPPDDDANRLIQLARAEGEAVLTGAGIEFVGSAEEQARRGDLVRMAPIDGQRRLGGSTWQSLARGTPVEVDYLNGEIVLLGRLHGVPAPVNELLCQATHLAVASRQPPHGTPAARLLESF